MSDLSDRLDLAPLAYATDSVTVVNWHGVWGEWLADNGLEKASAVAPKPDVEVVEFRRPRDGQLVRLISIGFQGFSECVFESDDLDLVADFDMRFGGH
jgi:hypothetical protein